MAAFTIALVAGLSSADKRPARTCARSSAPVSASKSAFSLTWRENARITRAPERLSRVSRETRSSRD